MRDLGQIGRIVEVGTPFGGVTPEARRLGHLSVGRLRIFEMGRAAAVAALATDFPTIGGDGGRHETRRQTRQTTQLTKAIWSPFPAPEARQFRQASGVCL